MEVNLVILLKQKHNKLPEHGNETLTYIFCWEIKFIVHIFCLQSQCLRINEVHSLPQGYLNVLINIAWCFLVLWVT